MAEGLGIGFTGGICVLFFFASAGNCESESLDAELANEDDDADGEAARDELFELDASPSLGEGMLALAEALSRYVGLKALGLASKFLMVIVRCSWLGLLFTVVYRIGVFLTTGDDDRLGLANAGKSSSWVRGRELPPQDWLVKTCADDDNPPRAGKFWGGAG